MTNFYIDKRCTDVHPHLVCRRYFGRYWVRTGPGVLEDDVRPAEIESPSLPLRDGNTTLLDLLGLK